VRASVQEAERRGRIVGVRLPPDEEDDRAPWALSSSARPAQVSVPPESRPARVEAVLANQVYVPKRDLPPALRTALLRLAAFQNPEFYKTQAMRLSTHATPRVIACAEDHPEHIGLPRGCREDVQALLAQCGIEVTTRDERCSGTPLDVAFAGELR